MTHPTAERHETAKTTTTRTTFVAPRRARWSTLGGGALLASFGLLLVATILEYGLLASPWGSPIVTGVFLALFGASLLLALVAVSALAFGSRGSDGIVGSSTLGKVALMAFGLLWLATEVVYLTSRYVTPDPSLLGATGVLGILMSISSIIAAVVIAVRGIATGVGRWSLIAAIVVSAVTGGAASASGDPTTITVLHGISALGMMLVGLSYLLDRGAVHA